jgi:hypothetical protein
LKEIAFGWFFFSKKKYDKKLKEARKKFNVFKETFCQLTDGRIKVYTDCSPARKKPKDFNDHVFLGEGTHVFSQPVFEPSSQAKRRR